MKNAVMSQAWLSFRGLYGWLNWSGYLSAVIVQPMMILLLYATVDRFALGGASLQSVMLGFVLLNLPRLLIAGVIQTVGYDRDQGTLQYALSTDTSRFMLYAARGLWHVPNALVGTIGCSLFGVVLLHLDLSVADWPATIAVLVGTAIGIAAVALALGVIALAMRDWIPIWSVGLIPFSVLTGVVIPSRALPGALRTVAELLPLTHGLAAFRAAVGGAGITHVVGPLGDEILIDAIALVVGYLAFALACARGRRSGNLELSQY